ncbi:MAG: hypothetical protein AAGA60_15280 [Cyanobacteria bacterium P01_E01_bin.42]
MSEENSAIQNGATQNGMKPALSAKSVAIEPRSLEKAADALMDDLFSDIDILLEGNGQLPTKPAKAEYVTLQSVVVPPINLPTSEPEEAENRSVAPKKKGKPRSRFSLKKNGAKKSQADREKDGEKTSSSFQLSQHADKIFFAIACLSLLGVGAWFLTRGGLNANPPVVEPTLPAPQNGASVPVDRSEDAPFINYMLRSLKSIASKPESPQPQQTSALPTPASNLNAAATPANSSTSPQVIERVYIPVYPPNPTPANPGNLSDAVVPPPPTEEKQPEPSASPTNAPSTPVETENVAPTNSSETSLPSPPPERLGAYRSDELPDFEGTSIPIESFDPPPAPSPVAPEEYNIKLAGVLEAGDSSGALFRIDDSTKRIAIGEIVGESGWTLVGVEGQTAIVQKDGEIRSIYVGQTF